VKPDLVISGINVGANVGNSYILSSGTVGGAVEAVLAGIPAIATGLEFDHHQTRKIEFEPGNEDVSLFSFAASLTRAVALGIFSFFSASVPPGLLINLNMGTEAGPESEIVMTSPAYYSYGSFLRPSDTGFYHCGSPKNLDLAPSGTDMAALKDGKISLSPISLISQTSFGGTEEKIEARMFINSIKQLL
jgi:5'-nucleotidase